MMTIEQATRCAKMICKIPEYYAEVQHIAAGCYGVNVFLKEGGDVMFSVNCRLSKILSSSHYSIVRPHEGEKIKLQIIKW